MVCDVTACKHKKLVLITPPKDKVRCTYCHLVISKEELADGYCPECYEQRGVRHYEFEDVEPEQGPAVRYRCEDCGAVIEWDGPGSEKKVIGNL